MLALEWLKSLLGEKRQEQLARSLSLEALDGFERIRAGAPELAGEALYERVMSARFGVDGAAAHELVEGARRSYADWPIARDVTFSDVVHYFIVERCLRDRGLDEPQWIHGRVARVVKGIIPEDL